MRQRSIEEVVQRMIREIPTMRDWQRSSLIARLRRVVAASKYTSPEDMQKHWRQVSEILQSTLGEPNVEWKRKIANIFADKDSI